MKKVFWLTWMVLGLFVGTALALDFSADVTNRFKDAKSKKFQEMKSLVWVSGEKWRSEAVIGGAKNISIIRMDKKLAWIIIPDQKMYMENKLEQGDKQTRGMTAKIDNEAKRVKLGSEMVNGWRCDKYKVTLKNAMTNKEETLFQYLTKDGLAIRTVAGDGSWQTDMTNIKLGKQVQSLFEVPAGYKKFSIPKMPAGMKIPKF